jgi:protein TonB
MSYAQRKQLSGNPILSVILTVLMVGGLLYTIITGLAYNVIKETAKDLKAFNVDEPPPPPEKPPPPPPKNVPDVPPPPVAVKPIVQTPIQAPVQIVTTPTPPPAPIHIQAPPAPPAPPPPAKVTKAQSAKGNLQSLFSGDDYPQDAIRNEETGRTTVRLSIGTDGRVTGCDVVSSSGSRSLDSATCRVLRSRARFSPAKLSNGEPTTDTYTQTIVWQLQ